jgi:hypothetical protein
MIFTLQAAITHGIGMQTLSWKRLTKTKLAEEQADKKVNTFDFHECKKSTGLG